MLKRQRQQSPPPSSSSIPLILPDSEELPNFKRRRTAPPLLDGVSRGWSQRDEDDDDLDLDDDEDFARPSSQVGPSCEYSEANSLLRELHTLNAHRLVFTPPGGKSHDLCPSAPRHTHFHTESPASPVYSLSVPKCQTHSHSDPPTTDTTQLDPVSGDHPVADEMEHVMKRYEGTNRLLGELFLSRRRELGGIDDGHPS